MGGGCLLHLALLVSRTHYITPKPRLRCDERGFELVGMQNAQHYSLITRPLLMILFAMP